MRRTNEGNRDAAKSSLERLFTTEQLQDVLFASSFLAQVPVFQLERVLSSLRTSLGAYKEVRGAEGEYLVVFERGIVPAEISLNRWEQISGLFFHPPRPRASSVEGIQEGFEALSDKVSLLVLEDGHERLSLNPDMPLAVGSAFKIVVLAALKARIESEVRSWSDVVSLQSHWKTLPSGLLQDWPDGAPLTLYTLAALMISQSDNSAADALISLMGREALESLAPRNCPFLTTREFFVLKDPANQDLLERYRDGDLAERRAVLEATRSLPLPTAGVIASESVDPEVEWFLTSRELCSSMDRVADLPIMGITPGLANPHDWNRVAFKGGSEPGVITLNTSLIAKDGKSYCVSAILNDDGTSDHVRFFTAYNGILESLK